MQSSVSQHLRAVVTLVAALLLSAVLLPAGADAQETTSCSITDLRCIAEAAKEAVLGDREEGEAASTFATSAQCSVNDTYQCAQAVALNERIQGEVALGGAAIRYYRLDLDRPGLLRFTPAPMPNRQSLTIDFVDAEHQRAAQISWPAGQPRERLLQVVSPGTYYLVVRGNRRSPEQFGLTVMQSAAGAATSAAVPDRCGINDTYQCAQPVALDEPFEGEVSLGGAATRYYRLDLDAPGLLRFSPDPMPNRQSLNIEIADAQYQRIERISWRGGEPSVQTLELASPGTYYLVVRGNARSPEQFGLTVTQAPPR